MKAIALIIFLAFTFNANAGDPVAVASWHHLGQISKVTIQGNRLYVRGVSNSGHECADAADYYGTLTINRDEAGFAEYYSMALSGYVAGKSMSCHITHKYSNGSCEMTNCFLR